MILYKIKNKFYNAEIQQLEFFKNKFCFQQTDFENRFSKSYPMTGAFLYLYYGKELLVLNFNRSYDYVADIHAIYE